MRNLNLVHLNGLRAVEAVGRLGSLQAAADELGVSIGAVSQQVIKTEQQLGHQLFERQPKGMVPTPLGEDALPRLAEAFRLLSATVSSLQCRNDNVLTISVAPVFAARWLVPRLGDFTTRYPDISIRLDANPLIVDPTGTDIDLCIRVGKGKWPGARAELLLPQWVFPVCTPALAATIREPADILSQPAIIDGKAMFEWDLWLSSVGLGGSQVRTGHVFSEASLCLDATIAGQGIMLAWQIIASHAIRTGQLVAPFGLGVPTGDGHYFVTSQGARPIPKTWIREAMREDMEKLEEAVVSRKAITP